jgi:hypothetical protein
MLVTQRRAGYNGILWDFMGEQWETADFRGFSKAAQHNVPGLFRLEAAVDKSVYSTTRESLLLQPGKFGRQGVEIVPGTIELADIQPVGIGDDRHCSARDPAMRDQPIRSDRATAREYPRR